MSASAGGQASDLHLGISILLGGSLFTLGVVSAMALLFSPKKVKVDSLLFVRDGLALLCAYSLLLFAMLVSQKVNLLISLSFIGLYLIYVIAVLLTDKYVRN